MSNENLTEGEKKFLKRERAICGFYVICGAIILLLVYITAEYIETLNVVVQIYTLVAMVFGFTAILSGFCQYMERFIILSRTKELFADKSEEN